MTTTEFLQQIHQSVSSGHLVPAFRLLKSFIAAKLPDDDIARRLGLLEQRYFYMLRSMAQGQPDPEQNTQSAAVGQELELLATEALIRRRTQDGETMASAARRFSALRPQESLETFAVDYLDEQRRVLSDPQALFDATRRRPLEALSRSIFTRLWTDFPIDTQEYEAAFNVITDEDTPASDRESWISALCLGLAEAYDPAREKLIINIARHFCKTPETPTRARMIAACIGGLVLAHITLKDRELPDALIHELEPETILALEEYARATGAPGISRRLREGFMPSMGNIGSEMASRMESIREASDDPEEIARLMGEAQEAMPPEARNAMQMLNEMALNGQDVFLGMLGPMHAQAFFNEVMNWWLPFDQSRSEFSEIFKDDSAALGEIFDELDFLCDSDKYALLMAVASTPSGMRAKALEMMTQQYEFMIQQMREMKSGENDSMRDALRNYMRNATRFYTLFRRKADFPSPFPAESELAPALASTPWLAQFPPVDSLPYENLTVSFDDAGLYNASLPRLVAIAQRESIAGREISNEIAGRILRAAEAIKDYRTALNASEYIFKRSEGKDLLMLTLLAKYSIKTGSDAFVRNAPLAHLLNCKLTQENKETLVELLIQSTDFPELAKALPPVEALQRAEYILSENEDSPLLPKVRTRLASALWIEGNVLESQDVLERIKEPYRPADILRGHNFLVQHQPDKALEQYRKSLGTQPTKEEIQGLISEIRLLPELSHGAYELSTAETGSIADALLYSFDPQW